MKIIEVKPLLKPIHAEIKIPGSKSYTNRSLLLAALTKGNVKITSPLISEDTQAMITCLKKLGIKITETKNHMEIKGNTTEIEKGNHHLNAQLSGTTIRFILAISAIIPGIKKITGKEGLNKRPIKDLVEGLRQLGARIEYLDKEGFPPLKVLSSNLKKGTVEINGSVSSQFISAILMIAPVIGEIVIKIKGEQISKPYVDMTIDIMKRFGIKVENKKYKEIKVSGGQKYNLSEYVVEGDYSSAGYFFAIAILTKSKLTIKNLNPESLQADRRFLKIIEKMGSKVIFGKNEVIIMGKGVRPINIDMQDCPDQVQTLSVIAAFAKGKTVISGIKSLRIKETDRVFAVKTELKKMGIKTLSTKNTLIIFGGNPKSALINTYGDHRMAMAFAVAGAKLKNMKISNPEVVNKTFPEFWKNLNSIGIKTKLLNLNNIVLIGMRGSGKTTIAKLLAKKLNKKFLELDEILEKRVKLTISEIVQKYGWEYFRKGESEIVKEISLQSNSIISTGGGVVTRAENIDALKKNGKFILLTASLETLVKRVAATSNRPSLTNKNNLKEEMKEILKQRDSLYRSTADEIIDTNNLTPKQVVDQVITKVKGLV